jgi:cell division septal protein FtsQ
VKPNPKPSRRKKSTTAGLRRFWIAFAFVLALAGVGAYLAATWPALYPRRIVVAGNRVVPSDQILAAAAIDRRRNLWLQNSHAIAARVEAIPFVYRVWVHRRLPADATIVVTERVPYAVVRVAGATLLVDRALRVLAVDGPGNALPTIVSKLATVPDAGGYLRDASVRELADDLQALESANVDVREVALDRYGGLVATRPDGTDILLGDDDNLAQKIVLIAPIESQTASGRKVRTIDLREAGTPVVVYGTP